jgi:hypothetical protein
LKPDERDPLKDASIHGSPEELEMLLNDGSNIHARNSVFM